MEYSGVLAHSRASSFILCCYLNIRILHWTFSILMAFIIKVGPFHFLLFRHCHMAINCISWIISPNCYQGPSNWGRAHEPSSAEDCLEKIVFKLIKVSFYSGVIRILSFLNLISLNALKWDAFRNFESDSTQFDNYWVKLIEMQWTTIFIGRFVVNSLFCVCACAFMFCLI